MNLSISSRCRLTNHGFQVNDKTFIHESPDAPEEFIKFLFKNSAVSYPKFYKMDKLSKLAFVCCEYLLESRNLTETYAPEDIGLIFSNQAASLPTDILYRESISDPAAYFPNPSLFVYTLPNIMVGELCIRHGIKGENSFYVSKQPEYDFLTRQLMYLFETGAVQCGILGWINIDLQNQYEAELVLVEKNKIASDNAKFYTFEPLFFKQNT